MSLATSKPNIQDDLEAYHGRVASALRIDCVRRIFDFDSYPYPTLAPPIHTINDLAKEAWSNGFELMNWEESSRTPWPALTRVLPSAPFRVLDAPNLRDDFYCSVLAYSPNCEQLAVGLGNVLYTWSEGTGPRSIHGSAIDGIWLTSIAFSSVQGAKCILAIGRTDGSLVLKSIPSRNPLNPGATVSTEDLIVGDDVGTLYYYVVEWPMNWEVTRDTWPGTIYLVAKLSLHSQQICGLAWSPNGRLVASGGNDNLCCLFDVDDIFTERQNAVQNSYGRID
ncbi:putative WD repeat-containing protein C13G6.08 [Cladobotryum mycophilum]|uniref:WD repeat-containing protein C13G6.08 n=1 Tax=Cladobotryum mycophilum TaxID=491253 RepID=A0ABR0SZ21_9HYPO